MTRLLRANFARLWKTRSFWVCFIGSAALCLINFLTSYSSDKEIANKLGAALTSNGSNLLFFTSTFSALYLGTDYSNGTIRNKLIIGHSRARIYFSDLITIASGGLIVYAAACIPVLIAGAFLGGKIGISSGEFALRVLIGVGAVLSICAVFTLLGMLFSSKSTIVTITLVLTFAMIIGAAMIEFNLTKQIFDNEIIHGIWRTVNDVLPSGQVIQLETGSVHNAELMPLYSLGMSAAVTLVGAAVFRKKDLK